MKSSASAVIAPSVMASASRERAPPLLGLRLSAKPKYRMLAAGLGFVVIAQDDSGALARIPPGSALGSEPTTTQQLAARPLRPDEWKKLRDIRVEAIKLEKDKYAIASLEDRRLSAHGWQELCRRSNNQCVFGLFKGEKLIGISLIRSYNGGLLFGGSYIKEKERSRGRAHVMYDARMKWLKDNPRHTYAYVFHRQGNIQSKALNRKRGVYLRAVWAQWADGTSGYAHWYRINQLGSAGRLPTKVHATRNRNDAMTSTPTRFVGPVAVEGENGAIAPLPRVDVAPEAAPTRSPQASTGNPAAVSL